MRVLLTDGNFKHTLATVRSLGKRGFDITVISHMRSSISFHSKYCARHVLSPNPKTDEDGFTSFILDLVEKDTFDVMIPISLTAVQAVSRIREALTPHVKVALPEVESLKIASHKDKTVDYAGKIGVPVPKTYYPSNLDDVIELSRDIDYPVVVKGSVESGHVIGYANSADEMVSQYKKMLPQFPIIQEYIPGEGYGFFALYNHGSPRAIFMHRRLREYPITGGPSALAEGIFDPTLKKYGMQILDGLKWHGLAMVEFKRDVDSGEFVLMEVNPKLWGSLELSIASGVDFPYLLCKMMMEEDIDPVFSYKTGVRFRWVFPQDIFNAIAYPRGIPRFLYDFTDRKVCYDIDPHDIIPNIVQAGMAAGEFILRLKQKEFRRPHGVPLPPLTPSRRERSADERNYPKLND